MLPGDLSRAQRAAHARKHADATELRTKDQTRRTRERQMLGGVSRERATEQVECCSRAAAKSVGGEDVVKPQCLEPACTSNTKYENRER